jgi:hypothetical protein
MHSFLWLRTLRNRLFSRSSPRTRVVSRPSRRRFVRPQLEYLETRTLLSPTTFTVNVATDNSGNPNGAGTGTTGDLRYCIQQADLPQFAGSTIVFDSTVFNPFGNTTIALSGGELQIAQSTTIVGVGAGPGHLTISGNGPNLNPLGPQGASRVFDITSNSAAVIISNMTINFGNAEPFYTTLAGNQGGDIFNSGNLTLTNCIVSNGTSNGNIGGPQGRGGAIFNATGSGATGATLTLNNTVVETSTATGSGGEGLGGGIYNDIRATVVLNTGSIVQSNSALGSTGQDGQGGGIYNKGTLQLNGTSKASIVIQDNVARGGDGFNGVNGTNPGGNAGIGGDGDGGGVFNTGAFTLQFVNFLGNQAIGGKGGTGGNGRTSAKGGKGGDGGNAQGGGIFNAVGTLTVPNSVFGEDSGGQGNQALGGNGGNGGNGGGGGGVGAGTNGNRGGDGGAAGNGGFAKGGAVANAGNDATFTNTSFTSSLATAGAGGRGGNGGNGSAGGNANKGAVGIGGAGANGNIGGIGGDAVGGAVFNQSSNLSFANAPFAGNVATAGAGGAGGVAGNAGGGGQGASTVTGGAGGKGGIGGAGNTGGNAQGGGFYNLVGTVTVSNSNFTSNKAGISNQAISGNGGAGGDGGDGGQGGDNPASKGIRTGGIGGAGGAAGNGANSGLAEGGAGGNQGGDTTLTGVTAALSLVQSGAGGAGGNGGNGGNSGNGVPNGSFGGAGGDAGNGGNSVNAFGGAFAVTASNLTVSGGTFGGSSAPFGNRVLGGTGGAGGIGGSIGSFGHPSNNFTIAFPFGTVNPAGNGGQGGIGASVFGGALYANGTQTIQITGTKFTFNAIISGGGGAGGAAGLFSLDGANAGINGIGGNAGDAWGGALYFNTTTSQTATLSSDTITSSSAAAGAGGAGAINNLGLGVLINGGNGFGSIGGNGGSVHGVGLASVNYNLVVNGGTFDSGTGTGGAGGAGGGASASEPRSFAGGNAGNGGTVQGGGIFFNNTFGSPLSFTFNGGSASGNHLTGGTGGAGGNAGASGSVIINGGNGGAGGAVQGGGLYVFTDASSVTTSVLNGLTLDNNQIAGGIGGVGGAGAFANGGKGGDASGGAIYSTSLRTTANSSLAITASTLAGDQATGGNGGQAGSATTPNGGPGGIGGDGGSAFGGGLFNGDNTPLTVTNSTFGGPASGVNPNANANILTGGTGGRGGNAGTPALVKSFNGGAGGNGGDVQGGNIFVNSGTSQFVNDTIVFGQALAFGLGNQGGGGAGLTGSKGADGVDGVGQGGGYYSAGAVAGFSNTIGNTILDLNAAATLGDDVFGTFTSMNNAGHNILGSTAGSTGFTVTAKDQIGVTAAQLNLAPLANYGGPTPTDALASPSVAIDAGNNTLVPAGVTTDQRGTGFNRIVPTSGTVDVGAFEVQSIVTLSPTTLPAANVGAAYNQSISASGGSGSLNVTFVVTTGTIPKGLNFVPGTGQLMIGGTPTATGSVTFTVTASDGRGDIATQSYTLAVNALAPITIAPTTLPASNVGVAYNQTITSNGGDGNLTMSSNVTAGTLPSGLSFTPGTNSLTISGTPTINGSVSFTVTVTDTSGDIATQNYVLTVNTATPITFAPPSLPAANVGTAYNQVITASGGVGNLTVSSTVISGDATGLTFTPGVNTLTISGKPATSGTITFTVTASDTSGDTNTVTYTLKVNAAAPITFSPPTIPAGTAGTSYNQTIKATGGTGNLTMTVNKVSGALPAGLSFNTSVAGQVTLSGTPTAGGSFTFTVTASDTSGDTATSSSYTLTINAAPPPPPPSPPSGPPSPGPGAGGFTSTIITGVHNSYVGLIQLETVSVKVMGPNGAPLNQGLVTFQVNNQTLFAPVVNGTAEVTFATGLLDFSILFNLFLPHLLTVSFGGNGNFAPSNASTSVAGIIVDFIFTQIALELKALGPTPMG